MKHYIASGLLVLMTSTSALAQWVTTDWALDASESRYDVHRYSTDADIAFKTAYESALGPMAQWTVAELKAISEWMSDIGFVQAKLPSSPAPFYVVPTRGRSEEVQKILKGEAASYRPGKGIQLSFDHFIGTLAPDDTYSPDTARENGETLAHELYHGVQAAQHPSDQPATWFSESIPEAVGATWAIHKYGRAIFRETDYTMPLYDPDDVYSRGHFFYAIGQDIGATPAISYLIELDAKSGYDGTMGLSWLDDYLSSKIAPLAEYFPRYIAKYAKTADFFGDAPRSPAPKTQIPVGLDTTTVIDQTPRLIKPVAATYTEAVAEFTGDWGGTDDQDRIYVNVVDIHSADRPDDARLIVGDTLVPKGERYSALIFAETGRMAPLITRVTNVAQTPHVSEHQTIKLSLQTAQVRFNMPSCVTSGESVQITVDGPLSGAENQRLFGASAHKLTPSAGTLSPDLVFTAPATPQEITFTLAVPTKSGGTKSVSLAPVRISSRGCMVRMTAGPAVLTYSRTPEYTEFRDAQTGQAAYFSETDLAIFDGDWQPIPPQFKGMILGKVRASIATSLADQPAAWVKEDGFAIHNMPRVFAERFAWFNLRHVFAPDGGKPKRAAAPCPNGESGCQGTTISMDGHPVEVVFNAGGLPVSVQLDSETMPFDYGDFDIRRPPGW